jgi:peptidyl-tRNA hydrolase
MPSDWNLAAPRIVLDANLTDGQAAVAAAHAALAWHLRYQPAGTSATLQSYEHGHFERVPSAVLREAPPAGTFLTMTESTLGGAVTCRIGLPGVVVSEVPKDLRPACPKDPFVGVQLRMYVLVRKDTGRLDALRVAAIGAVEAFRRHADEEPTRQWVSGRFTKTVCRVNDTEFERAITEPGSVVVAKQGAEVPAGATLAVRNSWPRRFQFFELYR